MRILLPLAILTLSCTIFSSAQEETKSVDAVLVELQEDFRVEGLTETERLNIEVPVRSMLDSGANASDIKAAVAGFRDLGLKGRVLSDSVFSMSYLVSLGESPENAGKMIHDTARDAMDRGVSGKNLVLEIEKQVKLKAGQLRKKEE
jgi:hypothetical protein